MFSWDEQYSLDDHEPFFEDAEAQVLWDSLNPLVNELGKSDELIHDLILMWRSASDLHSWPKVLSETNALSMAIALGIPVDRSSDKFKDVMRKTWREMFIQSDTFRRVWAFEANATGNLYFGYEHFLKGIGVRTESKTLVDNSFPKDRDLLNILRKSRNCLCHEAGHASKELAGLIHIEKNDLVPFTAKTTSEIFKVLEARVRLLTVAETLK